MSLNRNILLTLTFLLFTGSMMVRGQRYVAGHLQAREDVFREIPAEYIKKARDQYHIAFQRTSHGSHTSFGMYGLPDYKSGDDTLFAISKSAEPGKLELRDEALVWHTPEGYDFNADLSRPNETVFVQTTRNYLNDPDNADINVIMWAWCDIANCDIEGNYLPGMDSLIREYGEGGTSIGTGEGQREVPVQFIFMTGHPNTDRNLGEAQPEHQAQLITEYCESNGQFCLDYYSIDSHDMLGQYWNDAGDNGQSAAYGGNFYEDWQNSHILGQDYFESRRDPGGEMQYGDHLTQHITSNRKAYAMWWILARMAGWEGDSSNGNIPFAEDVEVFPNPGEIFHFRSSLYVSTCRIYSQTGAEVYHQEDIPAGQEISIDLSGKGPGVYIVMARSGTQQFYRKILVMQ